MQTLLKCVITSRKNLRAKYGSKASAVEKLLTRLVASDKKRGIRTMIVYIDDAASAKKAGIPVVESITRRSCKEAIDQLYQKHRPAYLVVFGAQDIIPFQEIRNPTGDEDVVIPSDLPYACDKPFGTRIQSFTGPTRVMGRIPDLPGQSDPAYITRIMENIFRHTSVNDTLMMDYFALSCDIWKKSTRQSLLSIFGNHDKLKLSPPATEKHTRTDLKPRTHFYNCHGGLVDPRFYGEKAGRQPVAQHSATLKGKITAGTLVAAECCYGAELYNPDLQDDRQMGIAHAYLLEGAMAFMGSSTVAYGPPDGQDLADLITQYFVKQVIAGSSTGRALLEARQQFLAQVGPHLDPYELKTLAQFYLLGDPSLHAVSEKFLDSGSDSADNTRLNLYTRGVNLSKTLSPSVRTSPPDPKAPAASGMQKILKQTGFTGKEPSTMYTVRVQGAAASSFAKSIAGEGGDGLHFRAFRKTTTINDRLLTSEVLVVKQSGNEVIGWKLYHRK
jgi:hypothetical protein